MIAGYRLYIDKAVMGLVLIATIVLVGKYGSALDPNLRVTIQGALATVLAGLLPALQKLPQPPVEVIRASDTEPKQ